MKFRIYSRKFCVIIKKFWTISRKFRVCLRYIFFFLQMKMRSIGFRRIVDDETGFFLPAWNILRSLIILNRYLDSTKMLHLVMCLCNLNTRDQTISYILINTQLALTLIIIKHWNSQWTLINRLLVYQISKLHFQSWYYDPQCRAYLVFLTLLAASSMYRSVYDNSGFKG